MQDKNFKTFNIRLPKEIWVFLKESSLKNEISMNEIINLLILKYKKSLEKCLTDDDAMVQ